jgi:hypothetical protein
MSDPLTPYGNKPMVTPIVNAVNYHYASFDVLRKITSGEVDGYTYHRDDNPTVREVEKKIAVMEKAEDCIETVVIAGSGPAGLTAAIDAARVGQQAESPKDAPKKNSLLNRFLSFLKPWLAFTGLYATFSVCPFCGQSGCPVGIGSAGLVGGVMALLAQRWNILTGRRKDRKHQHTFNKEDDMTKRTEFVKYQATGIDAGYHPFGFRIDKGADPLNLNSTVDQCE